MRKYSIGCDCHPEPPEALEREARNAGGRAKDLKMRNSGLKPLGFNAAWEA